MGTPTRFIETKEYREIMARSAQLRGHGEEMPPLLILSAYSDLEIKEDGPQSAVLRQYIQFADVQEPLIYREKALNNNAIVLISDYADLSYTFLSEMCAAKNAWAYTITSYGWEASDDDDWQYDTHWYFRSEDIKLPEFDLEDVRTH